MRRGWRLRFAGPAAALLALLALGGAPRAALCQTPSPLQEWQYPGGSILETLFEPNAPDWRFVMGVAADAEPLYMGSKPYRISGGPVIDIRYRDIAFASVGEGIGVNFLHGKTYRVGISIGYDLGRSVSEDPLRLHGLGDISPAPVVKLFAAWVVSPKFPLILRADARQFIGGADGAEADLEVYMPLPGSSKRFVMFAGPSITFADRLFMRKEFGVTAAQSLASGYPVYDAEPGVSSEGVGFSATRFITKHWLINLNAAIDWLRGSAKESPITEKSVERAVDLSTAYTW